MVPLLALLQVTPLPTQTACCPVVVRRHLDNKAARRDFWLSRAAQWPHANNSGMEQVGATAGVHACDPEADLVDAARAVVRGLLAVFWPWAQPVDVLAVV